MSFNGFDPSMLGFLDELAQNNERDWFAENKHRYERLVREPALDFIVAMGPLLDRIAPQFEAVAKKMGGSLMRVFRDTRFGRDKTPYKTNVGIQFRHTQGKDVHAPGYYLHIEPGAHFIGAGMWRPDPDSLAGIRNAIVERTCGVEKRARRTRCENVLARRRRAEATAARLSGGPPDDRRHQTHRLHRDPFVRRRRIVPQGLSRRASPSDSKPRRR